MQTPSLVAPRNIFRDLSLSAIVAGFVTVLVGFTSSAAIVFQAAQSLGANDDEISSWMWALGLGMGLTSIALSWVYRIPVVTAWSTPGAAMLMTSTAGLPMSDAIGAFVIAGLLTVIVGFTGWFERMIRRIPVSIACGMLGGVLLRFGMEAFGVLNTQLVLASLMFAAYILARRFLTRYAVVVTLIVGVAYAGFAGLLHVEVLTLQLTTPVFTMPTFSLAAILGIALPLFIVTMTSQNMPGVAVIRASGYDLPISRPIGWIGVANTLLAPFGAYALNLAAITAAICTGRDAHEDVARRYTAAIAAGVFYVILGLFGATVAALLGAFPKELIVAIAGFALLGTIGSSLTTALENESQREAALVTFLVTASGISLAGIGSAFWALVIGSVTLHILKRRPAH